MIKKNNALGSKHIENELKQTNLISGNPKNIRAKEAFLKEFGLKRSKRQDDEIKQLLRNNDKGKLIDLLIPYEYMPM